MDDKDIKKVFHNIEADPLMKARVLNNIYEKSKENSPENNLSLLQRLNLLLTKRKLYPIVTVGFAVILSVTLYSNSNIVTDTQVPSAAPPTFEGEYFPEEEFTNFQLDKVVENTTEIQIKNHNNDKIFKTITNENVISKLTSLLNENELIESSSNTLDKIAASQAVGNSVTVTFLLEDGTTSSTRVLLDLNLICINDTYYDIYPQFIEVIKDILKDIKNLQDINKPL